MTEYKHPVEYVPKCIRLFFFFSTMAWVSLFKPQEGQSMLDLVKDGEDKRRQDVVKELFRQNSFTIGKNL